jgi:hypothetical protein
MSVSVAHKHNVGLSVNGKQVYAYLIQPPLSQRLSRNPHLLSLIKEIVTKIELTKPNAYFEQDMGRSIGYSDIVELKAGDTVFYAREMKQENYTKFVKNRRTEATTFLTLCLKRDDDGNYEVTDVRIGKAVPPPIGDANETKQSKPFWDEHAIVYNGQAIIASTMTKDDPASTPTPAPSE